MGGGCNKGGRSAYRGGGEGAAVFMMMHAAIVHERIRERSEFRETIAIKAPTSQSHPSATSPPHAIIPCAIIPCVLNIIQHEAGRKKQITSQH